MAEVSSSTRRLALRHVLPGSLLLAVAMGLLGWFDYASTRRELLTLLVDQAASLRQAVGAAARASEAATAQTQTQLSARLLDNARLLRELDARHQLTQPLLDEIAHANQLFRVTIFDADGTRRMMAGLGGPPAGAGPGPGGRGFGPGAAGRGAGGGRGFGPGSGGGAGQGSLAEELLSGQKQEAVSAVHGARWDRGWRLSAGVARTGGGAIVLNVDAGSLAALREQTSLDSLLDDLVARSQEIAYIVLSDGTTHLARGPLGEAAAALPPAAPTSDMATRSASAAADATERAVADQPVLEFGGPLDAAHPTGPTLRLGLSLASLKSAERRTSIRLAIGLAGTLLLGVVVLALVATRREFGVLREKHALAEAALRRRDRLAAMGELASTVAHEVRNPLNAIAMSAQRLRREFLSADDTSAGATTAADREELRHLLDVLTSETQRINRIVQQFLDFARPPRLEPRPSSVPALLNQVADALRASAAARSVSIDVDASRAGDAVFDEGQLRQALDNLVRNAIEASPAGSAVTLRGYRSPSGHVIEVRDSGAGIAEADLPKIFDLYYTTKPDGTGVGLAVTHQIVDAHGGSIEVDSTPGTGTRMMVTIPNRTEGADRG